MTTPATTRGLSFVSMVRVCVLATAWVLAAGGCSRSDGPRLGLVRGKITLDGDPLAGAIVVFTPVDGGRQSFGEANSQGEFELIYLRETKGAIVGRHRVAVTTANEESPEERVPARYNSATILTFDVQAGNNEAPFDLTTE